MLWPLSSETAPLVESSQMIQWNRTVNSAPPPRPVPPDKDAAQRRGRVFFPLSMVPIGV